MLVQTRHRTKSIDFPGQLNGTPLVFSFCIADLAGAGGALGAAAAPPQQEKPAEP